MKIGKKLRGIVIALGALALVLVLTVAGLGIYVRQTARPYLLTVEEARGLEADCILVLGCGVRPDGQPSLMLRDRLEKGLELFEAGVAPKLLMSGDHGRTDYDEVGTMKAYAMEAGVPSTDVFCDHAGFSTYESMYRARDIFCAKQVVIVSQQYHLYRAVYDARALGLEAWGVPAEDIAYLGQGLRDFRELLAINKDVFYCLFKPEPTFLGDAIPVSGNGDLSNG